MVNIVMLSPIDSVYQMGLSTKVGLPHLKLDRLSCVGPLHRLIHKDVRQKFKSFAGQHKLLQAYGEQQIVDSTQVFDGIICKKLLLDVLLANNTEVQGKR